MKKLPVFAMLGGDFFSRVSHDLNDTEKNNHLISAASNWKAICTHTLIPYLQQYNSEADSAFQCLDQLTNRRVLRVQ